MDLKDIKAIIDLMKKNSIAEFELERQDFKIKLKRGSPSVPQSEEAAAPGMFPNTSATHVLPLVSPPASPTVDVLEIKSPMIGRT